MTHNQLPPLPTAAQWNPSGGLFTADQMHAYALAALAQQAQEPVAWRWMPSQEFPMWIYSDDKARVMEALRFMGHGGVQPLYTPPAPQPAPVDEQAEFEAWARPNGYDMRRNDVLGHYSSIDTLRAWTGWQARAALQSPAPQTKGQP